MPSSRWPVIQVKGTLNSISLNLNWYHLDIKTQNWTEKMQLTNRLPKSITCSKTSSFPLYPWEMKINQSLNWSFLRLQNSRKKDQEEHFFLCSQVLSNIRHLENDYHQLRKANLSNSSLSHHRNQLAIRVRHTSRTSQSSQLNKFHSKSHRILLRK